MTIDLTQNGITVLLKCLSEGCNIEFSHVSFGNGKKQSSDATSLSNELSRLSIVEIKREEAYVSLSSSLNNNTIDTGYKVNEIGVFITDPDNENNKVMFAYGYVDDEKAMYVPSSSEYPFETVESIMVWVGSVENVSAIISDSLSTVSKEEFHEHTDDKSNPHGVTKEQLGLGDVENKKIEDQTPEFSPTKTLLEFKSKEKISSILGKLATAVTKIIEHFSNKDNPHNVTAEQAGAAKKAHKHSASDINDGTLGVSRGGTGVASYSALRNKLGFGTGTGPLSVEHGGTGTNSYTELRKKIITTGSYVGNGESTQHIKLDHTPEFLLLWCPGRALCSGEYYAVAMPGVNAVVPGNSDYIDSYNYHYVVAAIEENGFQVSYCSSSAHARSNCNNLVYYYLTVR